MLLATQAAACSAAGIDSGAHTHPVFPDSGTAPDGHSPGPDGGSHNDAAGPDGAEVQDGSASNVDQADHAAPDAEVLPPMTTQQFLIGYNEAWFAGNFGTDYTTGWDLAHVQKTFDGIAKAGGHVVRLWLWEVPQGITLADKAPRTRSVSPELIEHLDTTLAEARKRGLWVYLTLLDANTIARFVEPLHTYGVNLLNNTAGEQDAFNANALAPVLAVLDAHKDNVFAIDVINEIQAAYKNGVFPDSTNGPRAFIQREVAFIKAKSPWVKVTASAGWPDDFFKTGAQYDIANGFYSGLGLDFYDLHVFADSGTFTGATAVCNRAAVDGVTVYLGEFGQGSNAVDDTVQYSATASFLNNAKALCFKGAFAWRYDAAELKWAYVRPDGSHRPAVSVMQVFGSQP